MSAAPSSSSGPSSRAAARAADGAGPDLEMVGRAAERSHRQPLGIPAIRMAAGSLGTSKTTETFRDPQSGHFNDPIMVIRKGGAKGIALLAAADELPAIRARCRPAA